MSHSIQSLLDTSIATLREDKSERNVAFFNKENMDRIQCGIINQVRKKGYEISRQSDIHLATIMQYVYNVHERNYHDISKMNKIVLQIVVPMIVSNIKQHIQWNKDRQLSLKPMDRGTVTSVKGENVFIRNEIF